MQFHITLNLLSKVNRFILLLLAWCIPPQPSSHRFGGICETVTAPSNKIIHSRALLFLGFGSFSSPSPVGTPLRFLSHPDNHSIPLQKMTVVATRRDMNAMKIIIFAKLFHFSVSPTISCPPAIQLNISSEATTTIPWTCLTHEEAPQLKWSACKCPICCPCFIR